MRLGHAGSRILTKMLERLFAAIVSGPSLNCRPHNSRQRIDFAALSTFRDVSAASALREILGETGLATLAARVPPPPVPVRERWGAARAEAEEPEMFGAEPTAVAGPPGETPEQAAERRAWLEQQSILLKLRTLVDDARTYEDDTGVYALNIGFPLLSLPPGVVIGRQSDSRRVLAPVAFIPVSVTLRAGAAASVEIACKSDEVDRVAPNEALLAWLEQQTGKSRAVLFEDEEGARPWKEIGSIVRHVAAVLGIRAPEAFAGDDLPESLEMVGAPRAEDAPNTPTIVPAAVLGLYPLSNQGLLSDTRAMIEAEPAAGPVRSFLRADISLAQVERAPEREPTESARGRGSMPAAEPHLVAPADPCQARAVAMARASSGLVVHGPPGTGKSQTITNIIGDHLARGERVLFVCDKRTALDVVANRLEHLGLGSLCAVIHDPQRDQRDLYMSVRDQLERLPETKTHPRAAASLEKIAHELHSVREELRAVHRGLSASEPGTESLHDLVGAWLALADAEAGAAVDVSGARSVTLADLESREVALREILERAADAGYASNPWAGAAGLPLADVVARPMDEFRAVMNRCTGAADAADKTLDPAIPPFDATAPLEAQAAGRESVARDLGGVLASVPAGVRILWAGRDAEAVRIGSAALQAAAPAVQILRGSPADLELVAAVRTSPPSASEVAQRLVDLEAYLHKAAAWYGFLLFGRRGPAAKALAPLGLPLSAENAARGRRLYLWLRAARVVDDTLARLEGRPGSSAVPDTDALLAGAGGHDAVLTLLARPIEDAALASLAEPLRSALHAGPDDPKTAAFLEGLRRSRPRANALGALEATMNAAGLYARSWLIKQFAGWRANGSAGATVIALRDRLGTLEDVLRVRTGLEGLPEPLAGPVRSLVGASSNAQDGVARLRRAVLTGEIGRRLDAAPDLRALDSRRLQTLLDRCADLEEQKREKIRDSILHRWVTRQRERLLASTGTRLSTTGADVRRRLTTRGRRAMRLRQVLSLGRGMEGGDPLLDLRPVWMASPETVAQIFPREPLFGAVIFDEASQCRLEEAMPVLTRGTRVVIAGDPKQLPPTRFFEAGVASSESAGPIETDQDLFEHQQREVEDLLTAALGLDIEQSYLDVHYRSRNSDLIAFSNGAFYGSRLQPLPGHPRNTAQFAPVTLYRAGGVYQKGTNEAEAVQVVKIVHDLLRRAEPPSIGIACFNLVQRDLIAERLEQAAEQDAGFSRALAAARTRRGESSFEGLFVKNLENVQGDERDHIIISTTYGPDPSGRFYRRFGPLGMPGGGRRLNVLVTRARQEVHLVTSIPQEAYRSVPPVPPGQAPGGGWLLFAYLRFAEELAAAYEARRLANAPAAEEAAEKSVAMAAECVVRETRAPSRVAEVLGAQLAARHRVGTVVHWGNEGFCVDLAARHPERPEDVTVGVLCDFNRFGQADDPIEWELFRSSVLASQGWTLQRLWSPVLFRDARGSVETLVARHSREAGRK